MTFLFLLSISIISGFLIGILVWMIQATIVALDCTFNMLYDLLRRGGRFVIVELRFIVSDVWYKIVTEPRLREIQRRDGPGSIEAIIQRLDHIDKRYQRKNKYVTNRFTNHF